MKIQDLFERKQQRITLAYHGTTSKFVPEILKHGLIMNPKNRIFGPDNEKDKGYETFPHAVYLSNSKNKAVDSAYYAAERKGGNPVLITVQYTYNSFEIDEDHIYRIFDHAIRQEKLKNFKAKDLKTKQTEIVSYIVTSFKKEFQISEHAENVLVQFVKYVLNKTRDRIDDCSEGSSQHGFCEYVAAWSPLDRNFMPDYEKIPVFKIFQFRLLTFFRQDPEFQNLLTKLMKVLKSKYVETLRIPRNIGFKGKTRIIEIKNQTTKNVYYQDNSYYK